MCGKGLASAQGTGLITDVPANTSHRAMKARPAAASSFCERGAIAYRTQRGAPRTPMARSDRKCAGSALRTGSQDSG
jgi:hypothetical protein